MDEKKRLEQIVKIEAEIEQLPLNTIEDVDMYYKLLEVLFKLQIINEAYSDGMIF